MDMKKYASHIKYQAEKSRRRLTSLIAATYKEERNEYNNDNDEIHEPSEKKTRRKKGVMARKTDGGEREILQPQQSSWYQMYVNNLVM